MCSACNMSLVADVYNKLHSRDDLVVCPSCGRLLYIPEDLPPEAAINSRGSTASRRSAKSSAAGGSGGGSQAAEKPVVIEPRAKGRWGELLNAAQGESVKAAIDAGNDPVSLQVMVNGELAGFYKGKTREHLERVIRFRMQEEGVEGEANVSEGSPGTAERFTRGRRAAEQQLNATRTVAISAERKRSNEHRI